MILYNASSSYYSMIARYALLESGISFENRRMDIHLAKEQLTDWYRAINPHMTVPSMIEGTKIWTDSQDILNFAALNASQQWMDSDSELNLKIQQIIYAHYNITIERLTFGKALITIPPLRFIIPRMLGKIIKKLEKEEKNTTNNTDLAAKIALNQQRLDFFTAGNLQEKLALERNSVLNFLEKLPIPQHFLFGDKPN